METIIGEAELNLTEIHKTIIPDIPPWPIRTPNIILTLRKFHPLIFQEELEKVKVKDPKHSHIFTDLNKITGCATIHKGKIFKKISQMIPLYSVQKLVQSTWLLTSSQNQEISNASSVQIHYQCWNHQKQKI